MRSRRRPRRMRNASLSQAASLGRTSAAHPPGRVVAWVELLERIEARGPLTAEQNALAVRERYVTVLDGAADSGSSAGLADGARRRARLQLSLACCISIGAHAEGGR